jgi:hypothetical protein
LLEPQPEEPKPKRGPGRPRKTQPEELLEPEEPKPEPKPKRGPGRPRKEEPKRVELPQEPKRGRPRKELKELNELKTPERWEQLDPIAELTRLIKQRNEEQARQRKTAYATMLGL